MLLQELLAPLQPLPPTLDKHPGQAHVAVDRLVGLAGTRHGPFPCFLTRRFLLRPARDLVVRQERRVLVHELVLVVLVRDPVVDAAAAVVGHVEQVGRVERLAQRRAAVPRQHAAGRRRGPRTRGRRGAAAAAHVGGGGSTLLVSSAHHRLEHAAQLGEHGRASGAVAGRDRVAGRRGRGPRRLLGRWRHRVVPVRGRRGRHSGAAASINTGGPARGRGRCRLAAGSNVVAEGVEVVVDARAAAGAGVGQLRDAAGATDAVGHGRPRVPNDGLMAIGQQGRVDRRRRDRVERAETAHGCGHRVVARMPGQVGHVPRHHERGLVVIFVCRRGGNHLVSGWVRVVSVAAVAVVGGVDAVAQASVGSTRSRLRVVEFHRAHVRRGCLRDGCEAWGLELVLRRLLWEVGRHGSCQVVVKSFLVARVVITRELRVKALEVVVRLRSRAQLRGGRAIVMLIGRVIKCRLLHVLGLGWLFVSGIVMLISGDVVVVKQVFVAMHSIRFYRQGRAGGLPGWGLDNQVVIVFRDRLLLSRYCRRIVGSGIYAADPFFRWMRNRLPVLLHSVVMAGVWLWWLWFRCSRMGLGGFWSFTLSGFGIGTCCSVIVAVIPAFLLGAFESSIECDASFEVSLSCSGEAASMTALGPTSSALGTERSASSPTVVGSACSATFSLGSSSLIVAGARAFSSSASSASSASSSACLLDISAGCLTPDDSSAAGKSRAGSASSEASSSAGTAALSASAGSDAGVAWLASGAGDGDTLSSGAESITIVGPSFGWTNRSSSEYTVGCKNSSSDSVGLGSSGLAGVSGSLSSFTSLSGS
ncbi:hypothetical protein PG984_009767 [Apiospora sp. TS-2023a]